MQCRPDKILTILLFVTAIGCIDTMQVGLSNARADEWRQARTERSSDSISNGDDSCERPGSVRPEPAPIRLNRCPRIERQATHAVALK